MADVQSLQSIAETGRLLFSSMLSECLGTINTRGSCLYSAVLLKEMLLNFGGCESVAIRGGDGLSDGGYKDKSGNMHGHYWIEATKAEETFLIDITADQFNDHGCIVTPLSKARDQYIPGNQKLVDAHVLEVMTAMRSASPIARQ